MAFFQFYFFLLWKKKKKKKKKKSARRDMWGYFASHCPLTDADTDTLILTHWHWHWHSEFSMISGPESVTILRTMWPDQDPLGISGPCTLPLWHRIMNIMDCFPYTAGGTPNETINTRTAFPLRFPSLISLMVSVDVKHHVYLLPLRSIFGLNVNVVDVFMWSFKYFNYGYI